MPDVVNAPITITPNTITAPVTIGAWGKSAYQSYLATTADDPVLSEAAWVASLEGPPGDPGPNSITSSTTSDGTASISVYSVGGEVISAIKSANYSVSMYAADDEAFIGFNINGVIMLVATPLSLTMNREILFPDASGTVALTSDITGTNSGTNTGDETASRIAALIAGTTNKATPADSDKLGYVTAAGGLVYALWSEIKTWLGTWLDAVATIAGAKTASGAWSFTSTTRPTSAGTGMPAATSCITRTDFDDRQAVVRDLFPTLAVSGVGTGATTQGFARDGIVGGYFANTVSGAGTYLKWGFCDSALMGSFGSPMIRYDSAWSLHTRHLLTLPSNTTQFLVMGGDGNSGIPSTNGACGFEITSTTSVQIWAYTGGARTNSTSGTLNNIGSGASDTGTGEHLFWFDCDGAGTLRLYWAFRAFGAAMPAKPSAALCTLATGVPTTFSTSGKCQWYFRTSNTPGAFFSNTGIRAAKFIEY